MAFRAEYKQGVTQIFRNKGLPNSNVSRRRSRNEK